MLNIKTKTTVKDIKVLDKSARLSKNMKNAFVRMFKIYADKNVGGDRGARTLDLTDVNRTL